MGRRCLIATLVLANVASQAQAAEVSTVGKCYENSKGPCSPARAFRYTAAPGEVNELSVAFDRGVFVLRDRTPIAAGEGCTARPDGAVACTAAEGTADLGDGDDQGQTDASLSTSVAGGWGSLRLAGGAGNDSLGGGGAIAGGPGDDRLTGQAISGDEGADTLIGTAGGDVLTGGSDGDTLVGGGGDDTLIGDGPGAVPAADVLDGGEGKDTVSYVGHVVAVRVDLAAPTGGAEGEGDRLVGFENARGGNADDVLIGDAGANWLHGESGRNTIVGGAGDDALETFDSGIIYGGAGDDELHGGNLHDQLSGGPGADTLAGGWGPDSYLGGSGDDRVLMESSTRADETVACGAGRDEVFWTGLGLLLPDCEIASGVPAYPRARAPGRLTFTIPGARRLRRGRVELRIRGRQRPFAMGRFAGGRATARATLTVPARIRRLRRSPLPVEVRVLAREEAHYYDPRFCVRWVIDLPR